MSTKSTISHDNNYHLYNEVFDYDNVWLQLVNNDGKLDFVVNRDSATVCINRKDFEKMIHEYLKKELVND